MAEFKKKFFDAVLFIAVALCSLFPCAAQAVSESEKNAETITYSGVYGKIADYLKDTAEKAHIPALSAIIVNKDEVLMSLAVGECTADTPFVLGSVSKSFTALCIKKLSEEGKIDLYEKISAYLPDATDGDKIKVIQLLNHTSGLGAHQTLKNYRVTGEQGRHVYSNVNYSLLGKIIEAVSGLPYEVYLSENVLKPLGMDKSAASKEEGEKSGLVQGYRNIFGFNVKSAHMYPADDSGWIQPAAGYVSSSAEDMGRYLQMYLRGGVAADGSRIISADGVDDMFRNGVEVEADIPYSYAMGWNLIKEPLPEPALRHSGLVETGMSCIYILPESGIGIAVLVNYNDFFVGQDIMDRLNWSVALMLMDTEPNEISANEFVLRHVLYDFIYFAVFVIAVLPLCLLGVYKKRICRGKIIFETAIFVLLHIVLPTLILFLPMMIAATPLWVVYSFVPDMFWTVVISAFLLYLGGLIKLIIFIKIYKIEKGAKK